MTPKLSTTFQAARSMVHIININTLKSIYYAYLHSITKYGIIFLGHSSNSGKLFTLQKKFMRIMAGAQPRTSCRCLFKQLGILPVPCQYILSLMTSFSISRKLSKQIHLYTILKQGISIIFIDQMPTYFVFTKVRSMLAKKFSTVYHLV